MTSVEREYEGKELEEALAAAAEDLGVPEAELHYEIVEQGRKGVFGVGAKSVRIRVIPPLEELQDDGDDGDVDGDRADAPVGGEPQSAPAKRSKSRRPRRRRRGRREAPATPQPERPAMPRTPVELTDAARAVQQELQQMIDLMGLELEAAVVSLDGALSIELDGADRKRLTEKNGELMQALQFLLNRMARRSWPDAGRIHLVCEGEVKQRDDDLIELTREVAQQVSRTGKTKKLHPMNAYERRLVHLTVREYGGLTSSSDGDGARKRVRISKVQNSLET